VITAHEVAPIRELWNLIGLRKGIGFRFKASTRLPCTAQPELFFSENAAHSRAAAAGCSHCPVLLECRLEGLERGEWGIWGGLSHNQRARMGSKGRTAEVRKLLLQMAQREKEGS